MAKKILLVGAAGGVGIEAAVQLVRNGHTLIATVLDEEQEAQLRAVVPDVASVHRIDLSNADQAKAELDLLLGACGAPLDAVVVCSGVVKYGPVETTALTDLRRVLEVNTVAVVAIFQAAIPYLRQSRGRFVAVSSTTGIVPIPLYGFYSASKHALEAIADAMRMEAQGWGVEVCLVQPGGIRTPMVTSVLATIDSEIAGLPAAVRSLYADRYDAYRSGLQNRHGSYLAPEDVAASLVEAVEADVPSTRHLIGEDALSVVHMKRTMSDRDLDAFFLTGKLATDNQANAVGVTPGHETV